MAISDRLYAIDPSAYEAPSATEGMAELLSVIDGYNARQDANKRADDKLQLDRDRLEAETSLKDRMLKQQREQSKSLNKSNRLTELRTSYGSDHRGLQLAIEADDLLKDDSAYQKIATQAGNRGTLIADAQDTLNNIISNPDASSIDFMQANNMIDWKGLPSTERNQLMMLYHNRLDAKKAEEKAFFDENPLFQGIGQSIQLAALEADADDLSNLSSKWSRVMNMAEQARGGVTQFEYLSATDKEKELYEKALQKHGKAGTLEEFYQQLSGAQSKTDIDSLLQGYATTTTTSSPSGPRKDIWASAREAFEKFDVWSEERLSNF